MKKLKAKRNLSEGQCYLFQFVLKDHLLDDGVIDGTWHSMKTGEIFHTDGISRIEEFRGDFRVSGI